MTKNFHHICVTECLLMVRVRLGSHQPLLRFDQRPVDAVHLVIKAAGVAQVMSGSVSAPQRRRHGPAVHALAALRGSVINQV